MCDWSDALLYERQKVFHDRTPPVTEQACVVPGAGESEIWGEVAEAVEALSDAHWESSPDNAVAPGLTGLETWLWYSGSTEVGPIVASWTDPVVGVVLELEGRAWAGAMTWDMGDGTTLTSEVGAFDIAAGAGGSLDDPARIHVYETSSAHAGHPDGYPIEMSILWVGEWRYRTGGGSWSGWLPMANTYLDVFTGTYDVQQIRNTLTGSG